MDYPELKELKCKTEYVITNALHNSVKLAPNVIVDNGNSISEEQSHDIKSVSRGHLNESITNPSRQMFFNSSFNQINQLYKELNFVDEEIIITALKIVRTCLMRNINDIQISKTGNQEILIYRKKSKGFSNLIIDEDCDISYMFIGEKLGSEKSHFFPKSKGFNYSEFASLL